MSHYEQGAGRGCESLGHCCTCPDTKKEIQTSRMRCVHPSAKKHWLALRTKLPSK